LREDRNEIRVRIPPKTVEYNEWIEHIFYGNIFYDLQNAEPLLLRFHVARSMSDVLKLSI